MDKEERSNLYKEIGDCYLGDILKPSDFNVLVSCIDKARKSLSTLEKTKAT